MPDFDPIGAGAGIFFERGRLLDQNDVMGYGAGAEFEVGRKILRGHLKAEVCQFHGIGGITKTLVRCIPFFLPDTVSIPFLVKEEEKPDHKEYRSQNNPEICVGCKHEAQNPSCEDSTGRCAEKAE